MRVPGDHPRFFARDNVYAQLKADVVGFRFVPGQHLKAQELKRTYDTKGGQVTEALSHLASEGLIEHRPNRGYFMRKPTWQSVEADYRFERNLARDALIYAQSDGASATAANDLTIRPSLNPDPTANHNPEQALTQLTADFYAHVIRLYDVRRASDDAIWLKDRLRFFRAIQFKIDPATKQHLLELIHLFETHDYDALIGSVEDFCERHVDGLDRVLMTAFGETYAGRETGAHTASDRDANGQVARPPEGPPSRGI